MMAALISFSTSSLLREYMRRECSMMCKVLSAWLGGSSRVRAEKAGVFSPPMTMLMTKLRLCICKRSTASKFGSNCLARIGASSADTRNDIIVPTLPNTASRTVSFICEMYWLATVRLRPYLRASDRMVANESVAKFWNSST